MISAIINTRNEEDNIRACLETLKWCDEIIVVDMESEDRTVAIAREYTDRIYTHKKVLAFDAARKAAVEKATGDWVLLIDADELVPKKLSDTLKELARNDDVDVVYIPFKTYIMGAWIRHAGWWPDYHPRFFRRGMVEFGEKVHSFVRVSDTARTRHLPPVESCAVEHFAYTDSEHFISKLNRYTGIEAQHLYDEHARFSLCRMLYQAFKVFCLRFFLWRGFRDGYRGFYLSLLQAFYYVLSYIKLWERRHYGDHPPAEAYSHLKDKIVEDYSRK